MLTVKQLAQKCGVSVRTLHHYDAIGLLRPAKTTEAGYRLYDEAALERLYLILLFRELGFRLKDIRGILDAPDFDRNRVLEQQIALLERKQRHLEYITNMARLVKLMGVNNLEFEGFDVNKIDDYTEQGKRSKHLWKLFLNQNLFIHRWRKPPFLCRRKILLLNRQSMSLLKKLRQRKNRRLWKHSRKLNLLKKQ